MTTRFVIIVFALMLSPIPISFILAALGQFTHSHYLQELAGVIFLVFITFPVGAIIFLIAGLRSILQSKTKIQANQNSELRVGAVPTANRISKIGFVGLLLLIIANLVFYILDIGGQYSHTSYLTGLGNSIYFDLLKLFFGLMIPVGYLISLIISKRK